MNRTTRTTLYTATGKQRGVDILINDHYEFLSEEEFISFMQQAIDTMQTMVADRRRPKGV